MDSIKAWRARSGIKRETIGQYGPFALIVLCGAGAYANSFRGVLLFDDLEQIVNNEAIRSLWPPWKPDPGSSRPVVTYTLAMNYAISGLSPWSYHAVNLAAHLLAACTLYALLRRTLLRLSPSSYSPDRVAFLATASALIWTLHPLQTQSVTYVIQRCESMMGLFYLLTIYGVNRSADSPQSRRWQALAVVSCAMGMGCKGVMITAPVAALIYDRIFLSASMRSALRRRGWMYAGMALSWGLLYWFGVIQGTLDPAPGERTTVGFGFKGISPLMYAATEAVVILHYLRLAIWPVGLCLDYAWPVARSLDGIVSSIIAVLILLYSTLWALRRKPALGFLGVWFFLILAPTSSLIPIQDPAFEHRMYLPLAAVVLASVLVVEAMLHRMTTPRGVARPIAGIALTLVAVATLGTATVRRNQSYSDELSMWSDVVGKSPRNARARYNLGVVLVERGEFDLAAPQMEEALRLDPTIYMAAEFLGIHRFLEGRVEQAEYCFRAALIVRPDLPHTRLNLAVALARLGRTGDARHEVGRVLRSDSTNAAAVKLWSRLAASAREPPADEDLASPDSSAESAKLVMRRLGSLHPVERTPGATTTAPRSS